MTVWSKEAATMTRYYFFRDADALYRAGCPADGRYIESYRVHGMASEDDPRKAFPRTTAGKVLGQMFNTEDFTC